MDQRLKFSLLRELYQPLLTEWQSEVLALYYDDDLSLGEIAALKSVSRAAVHDVLKRAEAALASYEQRLGLLAAYQERQAAADELETLLGEAAGDRRQRILCLLERLRG
jgi:predicted DNA-binding protein YlxM (UPF0122 family)